MQRERRGSDRLPDSQWAETMTRVRAEFEEMPCLCVTPDQARMLFGLASDQVSSSILNRLAGNGFLDRNGSGEYMRRNPSP